MSSEDLLRRMIADLQAEVERLKDRVRELERHQLNTKPMQPGHVADGYWRTR